MSAASLCSRSAPSHLPLGPDEGVKSWAAARASAAECSFIHLRLLGEKRADETFLLQAEEDFTCLKQTNALFLFFYLFDSDLNDILLTVF